MNIQKQVDLLRDLAKQYALLAWDPHQTTIWKMHAAINDLHPIRPIVLIDEIPWHELDFDGSLTLQCKDTQFREAENFFRRTLFQHKYFPGDMLIKPYFPIMKHIHSTGIGITIKEETKKTDINNPVVSHKYQTQFTCIEDLELLHPPIISYDSEKSLQNFYKISEAIGDILPIKLVGASTGYNLGHGAWDIIAQCMETDSLLYNLIDEPEFMHAFVQKLTDIEIKTLDQYEKLNLFNPDSTYVHSSAAASEDLRKSSIDFEHVKLSNLWGRGYAQILSGVSPDMHEEFEIQYAKKVLAPFGLVYYGCCEPLDNKISVIKQIPNLRKISITPWADINKASQAINGDYAISAKPNPAYLPSASSNPDLIRKEIRKIIKACRENNCPCELLLKDISTAGHNLDNLIQWNKIAMEEVQN